MKLVSTNHVPSLLHPASFCVHLRFHIKSKTIVVGGNSSSERCLCLPQLCFLFESPTLRVSAATLRLINFLLQLLSTRQPAAAHVRRPLDSLQRKILRSDPCTAATSRVGFLQVLQRFRVISQSVFSRLGSGTDAEDIAHL